jgi:hypothetical protein
MVGTRVQPTGGDDRLTRVVDMVNDAVRLLNQAIDEARNEKGTGDDDGDASGAPDRNVEQPR